MRSRYATQPAPCT
uniref:Uncharacterized protein n=1 Tax=Anopheles arabiensis TaxID=7173 RepID=A0A182HI55_ANOAR